MGVDVGKEFRFEGIAGKDGVKLGPLDGTFDGFLDGAGVETLEGTNVGVLVCKDLDGLNVRAIVGIYDFKIEGQLVEENEGDFEGTTIFDFVGIVLLGRIDGAFVGGDSPKAVFCDTTLPMKKTMTTISILHTICWITIFVCEYKL